MKFFKLFHVPNNLNNFVELRIDCCYQLKWLLKNLDYYKDGDQRTSMIFEMCQGHRKAEANG